MYKKIYYALLILLCSTSMYAAETEERRGAHPWKLEQNEHGVAPEFAHWTIALDAGFNSFDGDFSSEMKHPVWVPAIGLALEYNFTPMWFMGLEYNFDMYRVTGKNDDQHADILLEGMMHRANLYLGFDLISACYPRSMKKIFALDIFGGGGFGLYKNSTYYPDAARYHTATYPDGPQSDDKFHTYPGLYAGLLFAFNLGRVTSLGIKGTYSYFVKDVVDGRGTGTPASKNNDGIFDVTLNLRFKLVCKKKTHVRNISSYDVFDKMNEQDRLKDTIVISHVDTIYLVENTEAHSTSTYNVIKNIEYNFIYFQHDVSSLDDQALIDVQQLAARMKNEKDVCVEIIGFADNTGNSEYNYNLGMSRAQSIRDELVEEHFIPADRITYRSGGIIHGGRSEGAYTPNRRADIKLMNCEDFEEVKAENDRRIAEEQKKRDEAMAARQNGYITAPEGYTLSAIARKYYGNPYCWVFIFEANKTTLKNNPNIVPPKARLLIPDLSEAQLNISQKKADTYYNRIK